jgi:hypothetical protein
MGSFHEAITNGWPSNFSSGFVDTAWLTGLLMCSPPRSYSKWTAPAQRRRDALIQPGSGPHLATNACWTKPIAACQTLRFNPVIFKPTRDKSYPRWHNKLAPNVRF